MVDWDDYPLITIAIFFVLCVSYIVGGAWVFMNLEDWTFEESFYFVMITITTIGYGDLSPSNTQSRGFAIVYIFFSLFLIFAVFHVVIGYCVNKQVSRIRRRVERGTEQIDEELLYDRKSSTCCCVACFANIGRCICRLLSRMSSVVVYALLYIGWLIVWTLYFSDWNPNEDFSTFNALYFGVVTSSTVGYGDQTPTSIVTDTNKRYYDSRIFCAFWAILGAVFLALLANEVSRVLLWILYHLFACPCCCNNILTSSDELHLSNTIIKNIKANGVIDLKNFLKLQMHKDTDFITKLEQACELFDRYDVKQNMQIDIDELRAVYKIEHRNRLESEQSNRSGAKSPPQEVGMTNMTSVPV